MAATDTTERIKKLLAQVLEDLEVETDVAIDDKTFLPDLLDSFVLTALLAAIEREWSFSIAEDEIGPEIFEDLQTLGDFIESKTRARSQ